MDSRSHRETSLLLAIARCPNATTCLEQDDDGHPCHGIVAKQGADSLKRLQLPEPWSGELTKAPILFVGSNPSISPLEEYPTGAWPDEMLIDFWLNRFAGGARPWTKKGLYTLLRTGEYSQRWVRYWAAVRHRAKELLQRPARPGVDYCISEVVHCKSRSEYGVREALKECRDRYLSELIAVSGARVIVGLGAIAERAIRNQFDIPEQERVGGPVEHGDLLRIFAFLPHPNARQKHFFEQCLSPPELMRVRKHLLTSDTSA